MGGLHPDAWQGSGMGDAPMQVYKTAISLPLNLMTSL